MTDSEFRELTRCNRMGRAEVYAVLLAQKRGCLSADPGHEHPSQGAKGKINREDRSPRQEAEEEAPIEPSEFDLDIGPDDEAHRVKEAERNHRAWMAMMGEKHED